LFFLSGDGFHHKKKNLFEHKNPVRKLSRGIIHVHRSTKKLLESIFFHPDCTVGIGVSPIRALKVSIDPWNTGSMAECSAPKCIEPCISVINSFHELMIPKGFADYNRRSGISPCPEILLAERFAVA